MPIELQLKINGISQSAVEQRAEFRATLLRNVILGFIHFWSCPC